MHDQPTPTAGTLNASLDHAAQAEIVIAASWRRCLLSLVCCLLLVAAGVWLVASPGGVQQRGGLLIMALERAGIRQAQPGARPPRVENTGELLKVLAGVLLILIFGLVALGRLYVLVWRPRWVITQERIQCLSGAAKIHLEISLKDDVSSIEWINLREQHRPNVKPPLTARPILWLQAHALAVKHLCLGLRLANPEEHDQRWPRLVKTRALARKQFGVDLLIPVSSSQDEARAIIDAVCARLQACRGAGTT
jgi:hypothetical protein